MWYLSLPVLAFLAIAAMVYSFWGAQARSRKYSGRLSHLELICPVVGTASFGDNRFSCFVARRVTRLNVVFTDAATRIELPVLTASQRKNSQRLLEAFSQLERPRLEQIEGGTQTRIVGEYEGSRSALPTAISTLYQAVFDVDAGRAVSFKINATSDDHRQILEHWDVFARDADTQRVEAPVSKGPSGLTSAHRNGCLGVAASLFLLPIPFIAAYYVFNMQIAAIILFATSTSLALYRIWKRGTGGRSGISGYRVFLTPIGRVGCNYLGRNPVFADDSKCGLPVRGI